MADWESQERFVLSQLERLEEGVSQNGRRCSICREDVIGRIEGLRVEVLAELGRVRVDVRLLQSKAGVWGAIGGSVPFLVGLVIYLWQTIGS